MATQITLIPGAGAGYGYGNIYLDSLSWGCGRAGMETPIRHWLSSGAVAAGGSSIGAFTIAVVML